MKADEVCVWLWSRDRQRGSVLRSDSKTGAAVAQLMRPAVESSVSEQFVCICVSQGEMDSKCIC